MSFVKIPENNDYKKPDFLKPTQVPTTFQILDDEPYMMHIHNVRTSDGMFLKINHTENCPVCSSSDYLTRYGRPQYRYRLNILNTTMYKTCPKCGAEYNINAGNVTLCNKCSADLSQVAPKPLNRVQILEKGVTVFSQFNALYDSFKATNPDFDIKKITFMITSRGTGLNTLTNISPRTDIPVQEGVFEKFDLEAVGNFNFTEAEVLEILSGKSFKDIMSSRSRPANESKVDFNTTDSKAFDYGNLPGLN